MPGTSYSISQIDGDTLDIDYPPVHYDPDDTAPEAVDTGSLSAHLKGIDNELGVGAFYDSLYPNTDINSSANVDTFGGFGEISADVGTGKRLYYFLPYYDASLGSNVAAEMEIAVGAAASEVVIARGTFMRIDVSAAGVVAAHIVPAMIDLGDNVRLSVRVRDQEAAVNNFRVIAYVGPQ